VRREVNVVLTLAEARELRHVLGNGYGDGDFYDGDRRGERFFLRGIRKLEDAMEHALGGQFKHHVGGRP
jgi:hypothetical protein